MYIYTCIYIYICIYVYIQYPNEKHHSRRSPATRLPLATSLVFPEAAGKHPTEQDFVTVQSFDANAWHPGCAGFARFWPDLFEVFVEKTWR